MRRPILEAWRSFEHEVLLPLGISSEVQRGISKRVFFAGAHGALQALLKDVSEEVSTERGGPESFELVAAMDMELREFFEVPDKEEGDAP